MRQKLGGCHVENGSVLIILLFFYNILYSEISKKVYEQEVVPVSIAMKHILDCINSDKLQLFAISEQKFCDISHVKQLQRYMKQLLYDGQICFKDIQHIQTIINNMKQSILLQLKQSDQHYVVNDKVKTMIQALLQDALHVLDMVLLHKVADDINYVKESLLSYKKSYAIDQCDKKLIIRLLSIIEEIFQKYDGLFISAYQMMLLSQVALIIYLSVVVY